jgi:hypothetical protein
MIKTAFLAFLSGVLLTQGGTRVEPFEEYRSNFDPVNVPCAESVVRRLSDERNFGLDEGPKDSLRFITRGMDAFFIAIYSNDTDFGVTNLVMIVTNAGAGIFVNMQVFQSETVSRGHLSDLLVP